MGYPFRSCRTFAKYLAEQNLHLLSDTHKILYHLIGRNDAPFIYERAGNTWLYYMIDEFQDHLPCNGIISGR
jgi:ATP-dependent exoDNAse (exonuclease V) beta subunit